jgi:hypothetical protein
MDDINDSSAAPAESGDGIDGEATTVVDGEAIGNIDGEASPATSGEDNAVPEQPDLEIKLPGPDNPETAPETEPSPETTPVTVPEGAKTQSQDGDTGLTPEDDFLAEIQREREEQQQELRDDAASLTAQAAPSTIGDAVSPDYHQPHRTLPWVEDNIDAALTQHYSEQTSRLDPDKVYEKPIDNILMGDAGEGRTRVDLNERYGTVDGDGVFHTDRIVDQPHFTFADSGEINPDFAVKSADDPERFDEIVDSKAWQVFRKGESHDQTLQRLLDNPPADHVLNMAKVEEVIGRYSQAPDLAPDGKLVFYFPDDTLRYTPQVKEAIESLSGTAKANGRLVEVRSLNVDARSAPTANIANDFSLQGDAARR